MLGKLSTSFCNEGLRLLRWGPLDIDPLEERTARATTGAGRRLSRAVNRGRERRQASWRETCRCWARDRRRLCEESCALPAPKDFEPESPDSALSCLFVPNPIRKIRTYGIYGTTRVVPTSVVRSSCFKTYKCGQRPHRFEWGSGGRWFESSRPDIARAAGPKAYGGSCPFLLSAAGGRTRLVPA